MTDLQIWILIAVAFTGGWAIGYQRGKAAVAPTPS